ncbi:hypothetical protein EYF80_029881 [Liparis tanakae]|uniref:Uncharacterized protein n=1 Tax=Liparis tanakae TaxID=230148 RepID=A0A4Z2H3P0_9TELE|nr:hypothetical protein EYF80_029881 [Liparis tanakae]
MQGSDLEPVGGDSPMMHPFDVLSPRPPNILCPTCHLGLGGRQGRERQTKRHRKKARRGGGVGLCQYQPTDALVSSSVAFNAEQVTPHKSDDMMHALSPSSRLPLSSLMSPDSHTDFPALREDRDVRPKKLPDAITISAFGNGPRFISRSSRYPMTDEACPHCQHPG